jgi:hypothetical protein
MSYFMLATFADAFRTAQTPEEMERLGIQTNGSYHGAKLGGMRPEEMERLLADTVLKEFKTRLGRIGLAYQTPAVPA